ncbi:GH92 family glycosyl hydrolase [Mucilaginibacter sp.]|uniref:GH92 family glycosyl hydrolase n=1 Tax=Mucilaginibacter sp. TaxID=1882438 RepID=UPI00260C0FB3|nr:GH92 family glycosyl hydrolase [Mucilaginibacter sp.]MDB4924121.1 glycoside hydrolase family 92 protein [Mucilaginibacter sp.]
MNKSISRLFTTASLSIAALFYCTAPVVAQKKSSSAKEDNLQYVDPRIGNVGALLQPTRPTVQLPNQVMRMYPIRADYIDDQISSFPLCIVSHRLGEVFSLKPSVKVLSLTDWRAKQTWDHELEVTRPWYYSTYLIDDEITVEFTAGKKTGLYRFEFPANAAHKTLLFGLLNPGVGSFNFNGKEVTGTETYHDNIKVYLYGTFSAEGKAGVVKDGKIADETSVEGKGVRSFISFAQSASNKIEFRYAISYISPEQAKKNYTKELTGKQFADIKNAGEKAWADVIGKINVEGGTEAQKRSFYTAFYRCNERMVNITEDGQYYSGFDNKIHTITNNRPFYVDDWTWDTYLALHPLRTILNPKLEGDMANSYVLQYQQSGWLPTFPVLFGDHACMNGFHSTTMLLDDYRKGIRDFDVPAAYDAMVKNATQATMLPWRNGPKGTLEDFYYAKGYYPALKVGEKETIPEVNSFEKRQAVAVTLGTSFDDWSLGQMAKELGKNDDYTKFNARSKNYKNLWKDDIKMFMPKDADGNWINIDPKFDGGVGGRDYFDENNGWTYLWQVQHDIPGLTTLMGGKAAMQAKLDQLFREPLGRSKYEFWSKFPDATGLVGEFSMGNEPSFHIPYLYNYAGAPWKTQAHIRLLLDLWYKDNVFGIPGDEDGGGMTAFVVFSSMGFYPITPGSPIYTIGSPVFKKVTINLQNGKQFTMIANNCSVVNKYIQSAKFNGKTINTPQFTHAELVAGGKLELEMGPKPNKSWGLD